MALTTRRGALTTLGAALAGTLALPAGPASAGERTRRPRPLWHAHAHNDYEHPRPLFDALDHRFGSVEADIFLVGDQLLIGHEASDLDPSRTLESLYLEPLAARVRANHGTVHRGSRRPLKLLVDIKTEGSATYLALDRHLRRYPHLFTRYAHGRVHPGPVTAVISAWAPCEVEKDDTGGFNKAGEVILHVPAAHTASVVAGHSGGWLRCRLVEAAADQPAYVASPTVRRASAFTIGGTVEVAHAETVVEEVLGLSEGVPGQGFRVARPPVVAGEAPFVVEVAEGRGWVEWTRVDDFAHSTPYDRHITLDPNSGQVDFGPAVREPDGTLRLYGAVPPKGASLRVRSYRTGGGRRGNVARGALRVLRSSLPFVARVENRRPALGGVDGETVENARVRGPMALRTLHRAVVPHDYELLAREVAPDAARVACVPARPAEGGQSPDQGSGVRLLVVPAGGDDKQGRIRFQELIPPQDTLAMIASYLDERRPIGTRLVVEPPYYQGVTVVASVVPGRGVAADRLREATLAALYGYFNPLSGGPEGKGWPFGRPVHSGEVFAVLQRVPGVDLVEDVRLFPADPLTGERGEASTKIELDRHALVFSYEHQLRVREA
ncbi:putative baseplate assembly protein [Streptomyces olivaceoviridis]